eukprot:3769548-Pleurochrysis_carterae.AAC.1
MMIAAAVLAGVVASGAIDEWTGFDFLDIFGESYSMQLFGVVFGYFTVNRLGISYDRYREGVFSIKTMHSKWFDACAQERERRPVCEGEGCVLCVCVGGRVEGERARRARRWAHGRDQAGAAA